MRWSVLLRLAESKAFWSLNLLLLVVPLIARFGVPVSYDIFWLYIAAWLLLLAGTLIAVFKPAIVEFRDHGRFIKAGNEADYLRELYEREGGQVQHVEDEEIKTCLENKAGTLPSHPRAFRFVYDYTDNTHPRYRWCITVLISVSILIIIIVNVGRFSDVLNNVRSSMESKDRIAEIKFRVDFGINMRVGGAVEVTHEDGAGGKTTTRGKLLASDDNGYVVVEDSGGKLHHIPKGRVILITCQT